MARAREATKDAPTATTTFFRGVADRGREPSLHATRGTIRFHLRQGARIDPWCITVDEGDLKVSHRQARADAVVRTDRELFDEIVTGKVNPLAATLRGLLVVEGDLGLVLSLGRLFQAPPTTGHRKRPSPERGRPE